MPEYITRYLDLADQFTSDDAAREQANGFCAVLIANNDPEIRTACVAAPRCIDGWYVPRVEIRERVLEKGEFDLGYTGKRRTVASCHPRRKGSDDRNSGSCESGALSVAAGKHS